MCVQIPSEVTPTALHAIRHCVCQLMTVAGTAACLLRAGFMVSRMLGVAPTIADAIIDQLSRPTDKAVAAGALLL